MKESVSVCIPVYNGANTISETIRSILAQTFRDFELIIVDNASTDATVDTVKAVGDERVKLYVNGKNLGCGGNLEECRRRASGSILFYMAADDLADKQALEKVYEAFQISDEIGVVTRPYFWFSGPGADPVRATKQFKKDRIVSIDSPYGEIRDVIGSSDQISGIGVRKRYMNFSFGSEQFVEMAALVTRMLKDCKAVILKDNIVAVRMQYSGAANPAAYLRSPILAWYNLINRAYGEDKFKNLRNYLVKDFVATNYIGLVQIKNFGGYKALFREIYYLIRFRWLNIFNLRFWFFCIGTVIVPRFILRRSVIFYKEKINSRFLKNLRPLST